MTEQNITLYELADSYQKLEEIAEDNVAMTEYLDAVQEQLENKIDNIVRFTRSLEVSAEAVDIEIKRLTSLKKSLENKNLNLRNYIEFSMKRHGIEKVDTGIARLSFRKSKTVEIDDLKVIPIEYTKTTITADKVKIKKALESGEYVEGARIEEHNNLQIK